MPVYSIIMIAVSILFFHVSSAIFRGNTRLIHDYHQTKVTDQKAYGKAFGKAMYIISAALLVSGIIAISGSSKAVMIASVVILLTGICVGTVCLVIVQKKYNKGLF